MIQSEFAHLIEEHAATIHCADLETLAVRLPEVRARVQRHHCREYPQLPDQVEFLALLIEDTAAGLNQDLPLSTLAEAAFALNYLLVPKDVLSDELPGIGFLDDAMIVGLVLQRHQALFRDHPRAYKLRWPVPTVRFEAVFAKNIRALAPRVARLPVE
jgi:uncharacterized membrane protein YkvA (DUF1232 family)